MAKSNGVGMTPDRPILEFGGYALDPAQRCLKDSAGSQILVKPRVFDTLAYLAGRAGEVVSKHEIIEAVWPGVVVEENNLNQAISAARRALGDQDSPRRFIVTVPGRGYQFIAPVSRETPGAEKKPLLEAQATKAQGSPEATDSSNSPPATAVLPFANISLDHDQDYFADGITEEIRNRLAQIEGLRVVGRTSSYAFKNRNESVSVIREALGVGHVLGGSVRKHNARLRIAAELVNAEDGYEIWSEVFDRELDDIFAVQDEIAMAVAEALSLKLGLKQHKTAYRGTDSFTAYDHYLRGLALYAQGGTERYRAALAEHQKAIEADPNFGLAWASIANVAVLMTVFEPEHAEKYCAMQAHAVERSLAVAPDRWEVQAQHAWARIAQRDWLGAEKALGRAARLGPTSPPHWADAYGTFLVQVGRAKEAVPVFEAARASDPLSLHVAGLSAWSHDLAGNAQAALAENARAEGLVGDRTIWAFQHLLRLLAQGDRDPIIAHFENYPDTTDDSDDFVRALSQVWEDREAALDLIRRIGDDPGHAGPHRLSPYASLAAYYKDDELALHFLREDFSARGAFFTISIWHPLLADVRKTDGFREIAHDLGLVNYWRQTGKWGDFCKPDAKGEPVFGK